MLLPFIKLIIKYQTPSKALYTLKSHNRLEDIANRWGNKNSGLYLMTGNAYAINMCMPQLCYKNTSLLNVRAGI